MTTSRNKHPNTTRQPAVSGIFYPSNSEALKNTLRKEFAPPTAPATIQPLALICPHAGIYYSGHVTATAIKQLDPQKKIQTIFLIGTSHYTHFNGASIGALDCYSTPLGTIDVNTSLANELIQNHNCFQYFPKAHAEEHGIEMQLPFLQYHLRSAFQIIPIIIGTNKPSTCKKIAQALQIHFKSENLFIVSSDFSHYPSFNDAIKIDQQTAAAIQSNSSKTLLSQLEENTSQHPQLATSLCGWTSVFTLLNITEKIPEIDIQLLEYRNSGHQPQGDRQKVVGYWAINFRKKPTPKAQTIDEYTKTQLLALAQTTLEGQVKHHRSPSFDDFPENPILKAHYGAFISLYNQEKLRACLGQFPSENSLREVIIRMTQAAATSDIRFHPIDEEELNSLQIEISIIKPLKKIHSINDIELGRHGIYIKTKTASGTYLPQVAIDAGWTVDEFLGHCAKNKAGIGWNGWKKAEIYIFETIVIKS